MKQQLLFSIEQIRENSVANKIGFIFFSLYMLFIVFALATSEFQLSFTFTTTVLAIPIVILVFFSKGKINFDEQINLQHLDIYVYSDVIEIYSSDKLVHRLFSKDIVISFKSSGALLINKGSENILQIPATLTDPGVFSFIWRFTVKRELGSLFLRSNGAYSAIVDYFSKGSTLKKVVKLLIEHGYNAKIN
jgi:hypothetical protein